MNPEQQAVTIHLVEDSDLFRGLLESQLSPIPNARLIGFSSRADVAVAQIRSLRPHLVILDIQLEAGSGLDVLRGLFPAREDPHVIVLTNQADSATRDACLAAGAAGFFDKSTEFHAFLDAVGRFISVRSASTTTP